MLTPGIVVQHAEPTVVAETIATAKSARQQKAEGKQRERETTLAFIAKFEARLHELTVNPPAELSPVKLMGVKDSIEHTIADLRRQLGRRKTATT